MRPGGPFLNALQSASILLRERERGNRGMSGEDRREVCGVDVGGEAAGTNRCRGDLGGRGTHTDVGGLGVREGGEC